MWAFKKGPRRNEALDIFVYNFVALKILNPNSEMLEKIMASCDYKPLKNLILNKKSYKIRTEKGLVCGFKY